MSEDLVSIVVPVYNAENFLSDTIENIQSQTYSNWELIFVDDCSTDKSVRIIENAKKSDSRISLIKNEKNVGAAITRNNGINKAKGKYLCFQDADDLWDKSKLEKQIKFMKEKKCAFSYTGYQFADAEGNYTGKKVYVPEKISYKQALKNTTISTITVMFDMKKLTKEDISMPNVKNEDTATWWKILKQIEYAWSINEILSYYRRSKNTSSSNKFKSIKNTWYLYRKVEKLNFFKALYNFNFYIVNAIKRRI